MRILLTFSIIATLAAGLAAADAPFAFFEPLDPPRGFQVVAAGGLSEIAPPNSAAALQRASEDGVEWARVDVRLSSDGRHVLVRDATLEKHTDGNGAVADRTLAELKAVDAGSWFAKRFAGTRILSLEESLALAKGRINLLLDCHAADPAKLVESIRTAGMEKQTAVLAQRDVLARVAELSGGSIALAARSRAADGFDSWLKALRPAIVAVELHEATPEVCQALRDRGVSVYCALPADRDNTATRRGALAAGVELLESDVPEELIVSILAGRLRDVRTKIACHRGGSRYAPENTLPALAKALRLRVDFVEFDVRPSHDGTYYLLHDDRLDRTTAAKGSIREATDDAIVRLDAGVWFARRFMGTRVPTLDDFLEAVPPGMGLYFDAKDIAPADLVAALGRHELAERAIVYQGAGYLAKLKELDPAIRRMPPASTIDQVTALARSLKPFAVDTPWRALSKAYIDHCHAAGVQVFSDAPSTANVDSYRQAIRWGIDLIQTDYPLRYWRAVELEQGAAGRSVR